MLIFSLSFEARQMKLCMYTLLNSPLLVKAIVLAVMGKQTQNLVVPVPQYGIRFVE